VQRRVVSEWVRRSGEAVGDRPSTASARRVKATLTSCRAKRRLARTRSTKRKETHLVRRRSVVTLDNLFPEVGMALARADAVEEVAREGVKRFGLLGVLQRVVEIQSLEAGLHLDLGDGESPHRQSREEEVPVLGRDEVGRRG
jgi:hypothetical protein